MSGTGTTTRSKDSTSTQQSKQNSSSATTPTTSAATNKHTAYTNNTTSLDDTENRIVDKLEPLIHEKLELIKESILDAINDKLSLIVSDVNLLKKRIDEFDVRLNAVEECNINKIASAGAADELNRLKKLNDIVINGIPYTQKEKPIELFNNIAKCINATISPYVQAYRTRSKIVKGHADGSNAISPKYEQGGTIIVKLSCPAERNAFFDAIKRYKKPITLKDIDSGFTSSSSISIFESLLPKDDVIRKKARQLRKESKISSVRTSSGAVFVKVNEQATFVKITDLEQLDLLVPNHVESAADTRLNDKNKD